MTTSSGWNLQPCIERLRTFRDARDWSKFHNPRDLAAALAVEAGELQERFLWKGPEEVEALTAADSEQRRAVEAELADVVIYALYLADRLGTNLSCAVLDKIAANERRYEATKHRGVAEKAERDTD